MTKTWTIQKFDSPTDLIRGNYLGNYPDQMRIYLCIDWIDQEITAEPRNYDIGGTPSREYKGYATAFQLPASIDASEFHEWVETELLPQIILLAQLRGGPDREKEYTVQMGLEAAIDEAPELPDGAGYWYIGEWIQDDIGRITADSTDEEIGDLAREIDQAALEEKVVLSDDAEEYLKEVRNDMRADRAAEE